MKFSIGTFNVRGLNDYYKQIELVRDMESYKIDVCTLQETKVKDGFDKNIQQHRLISLKSESKYYGNGFFISKEWRNNIHRCWKVSDRIAVLQLTVDEGTYEKEVKNGRIIIRKVEKYSSTVNGTKVKFKKVIPKDLITIINVYAPHTQRLLDDITRA